MKFREFRPIQHTVDKVLFHIHTLINIIIIIISGRQYKAVRE